MERALLICDDDAIKSYHLPPTLQSAATVNTGKNPLSFAAAVDAFEKELIVDALKRFKGNQTKAAEFLDSSLRIINYKIHKHGLDSQSFKVNKE
jgi:Nif-specific regulatory protein